MTSRSQPTTTDPPRHPTGQEGETEVVKTKAAKRMEKKAERQQAILERLLPQGRQPSTIGWRRVFRPYQSRLEQMPLTKNTVSTTPPDEL